MCLTFQQDSPLHTSIIKGMKAVCDMCPEFQEIAAPIFQFANSESTEKSLKGGVMSLESTKSTTFKMMEFMAIMVIYDQMTSFGAQWLSGRVLDSRLKGCGLEPYWRHCVVSLSKNINPSLVLVQPRKTRPYITERLLMGRKYSNQTNNISHDLFAC